MKTKTNPWDNLGKMFKTKSPEERADSASIDNIEIAWPVVLDIINKHFGKTKNLEILDHGCGTGEFINKLHSLGYKVSGQDTSKWMVEAAKSNCPKSISIYDQPLTEIEGKFDVVTSIMVMQFIRDIKQTVEQLSNSLNEKGLLIAVVFNPLFVKNFISVDVIFKDFDSKEKPEEGFLCLDEETCIPTYIRSAKEYNEVFSENGFKDFETYKPTFTNDFAQKYPDFISNFFAKYPEKDITKICEHLVVAGKKH